MIKITKTQKEALEKAGLIKYRKVKNGIEVQSPNLYVANREHMGTDKTYYVVEEYKILQFLGLKNAPKKHNFKKNEGFLKNDR